MAEAGTGLFPQETGGQVYVTAHPHSQLLSFPWCMGKFGQGTTGREGLTAASFHGFI